MMLKANAGCAARAHVTRASAIRAHAQRLPLAVIVFLLVLFFANTAYADDWYSVLYDSQLDSSNQYIVSASNRYDAAAFICGKSKSDVDSITLEQRAKLSLNGGHFQELAESLDDVWPWWNDDGLYYALENTFGENLMSNMTLVFGANLDYPYVHFNPNALSVITIDYWQSNCPTKIFACNVSPQLVESARADLQTILDGGSIGGGGAYDGPVPDGYVVIGAGIGSKTDFVFTLDSIDTPGGGTLTLDMTQASRIEEVFSYPDYVVITKQESSTSVRYLCVSFESGLIPLRYTSTGSLALLNPTNETKHYNVRYDTIYKNNNTGIYVSPSGGNNVFGYTVSANSRAGLGGSSYGYTSPMSNVCTSNYMGGSGSGGDDPNPWPTPVPPEQPNVPEPPDVSPPPIGGPVFPTDPPQDPTTTPEPEPTGTDYTVYLKAIIRQLNQVMVQMSNHCKHIRDQISTSANAIISNMHTFIDDLQEAIDSNFSALNDYLEDLTKWYEQFTNDVISDLEDELSTIQSILRQILRKIGVSRGTPREVEKEVDDDFNFFEWLINFITSKLAGVIDEFVGDVGALINGVKDKFPFSIPWDIAAILAILDGVPVTPNFTITIPAINGWWQATTFNIDLRPYDSVAAAVRIMINAWWVLTLAMKTNWMLDVMGNSTSIGERIANRISGGGE